MQQEMKVNGNGNGAINIYTPDQVANILGVSKRLVSKMIRDGRIRGAKIGKEWRVAEEALQSFLGAENGNGRKKKRITRVHRDKIRFHVAVKNQERLPQSVENIEQAITQIKDELPALDHFKKIASIAKLETKVKARQEKLQKQETMADTLTQLAESAYPGLSDYLEMDPDEIERLFVEGNAPAPGNREVAAANAGAAE